MARPHSAKWVSLALESALKASGRCARSTPGAGRHCGSGTLRGSCGRGKGGGSFACASPGGIPVHNVAQQAMEPCAQVVGMRRSGTQHAGACGGVRMQSVSRQAAGEGPVAACARSVPCAGSRGLRRRAHAAWPAAGSKRGQGRTMGRETTRESDEGQPRISPRRAGSGHVVCWRGP